MLIARFFFAVSYIPPPTSIRSRPKYCASNRFCTSKPPSSMGLVYLRASVISLARSRFSSTLRLIARTLGLSPDAALMAAMAALTSARGVQDAATDHSVVTALFEKVVVLNILSAILFSCPLRMMSTARFVATSSASKNR
ncbi:hypothetical protein ES708_30017 [subsurface metagenome]